MILSSPEVGGFRRTTFHEKPQWQSLQCTEFQILVQFRKGAVIAAGRRAVLPSRVTACCQEGWDEIGVRGWKLLPEAAVLIWE